MNLADLRAQIEEEISWRSDEIRFFRNQLSNIELEQDKDRYRKALVVILYSHYEGFCKQALSIYAGAINNEQILFSDATDCIIAASLAMVFKDLDSNKKSDIFKSVLPDDSQLHRFTRQVDLITSLSDLFVREIEIPIDNVVETESNLRPSVLRKILYKLGFPHDSFEQYEGLINQLINRRNIVAHGGRDSGLSEQRYIDVEEALFKIMDQMMNLIVRALHNRIYLKTLTTSVNTG